MVPNATYLGPFKAKSGILEYKCEKCDYSTSHLSHWKRHLKTKKHNATEMLQNATCSKIKKHSWICICGKTYCHHSSYYRHKYKCKFEITNNVIINQDKPIVKQDEPIDKTFLERILIELAEKDKKLMEKDKQMMDLINQMSSMQNQLVEVAGRAGNNNNNNNFNINLFLNEKCKDAISIQAFANSLKHTILSSEDFISGDQLKLVNLIENGVKQLNQIERPMHVHKKKWYVKDEKEGWEDDLNGKAVEVVNNVAQHTEIGKPSKKYPNWAISDKHGDDYAKAIVKMQREITVKEKTSILKKLEPSCKINNNDETVK